MDSEFKLYLEEDNLWAEELGINLNYPTSKGDPESFKDNFRDYMLGFLAACAEEEHGPEPTVFYSAAREVFGEPVPEMCIRDMFGCHSLADFWQQNYSDYVTMTGNRFKLCKLPGDDISDPLMDDFIKLREECAKKNREKKEIRLAEAAEPENVRKYMDNFNILYKIIIATNKLHGKENSAPVLYSDLRKAYLSEFNIDLNAEYIKEHFGRSSFKLVFQDNANTIFSKRLNYEENPGSNGVFSISIKRGVEEFTKEEREEAVAEAQRNKEKLANLRQPQQRTFRTFGAREVKPERIQLEIDEETRRIAQGTSVSRATEAQPLKMIGKSDRSELFARQNRQTRNLYGVGQNEATRNDVRHPIDAGQKYSDDEESEVENAHRMKNLPPLNEPNVSHAAREADDLLSPTEQDGRYPMFQDDNYEADEMPRGDIPYRPHDEQSGQASCYNQSSSTFEMRFTQNQDYFQDTDHVQEMMLNRSMQQRQPVQAQVNAQQFAPIHSYEQSHRELSNQGRANISNAGAYAHHGSIDNQGPQINSPMDPRSSSRSSLAYQEPIYSQSQSTSMPLNNQYQPSQSTLHNQPFTSSHHTSQATDRTSRRGDANFSGRLSPAQDYYQRPSSDVCPPHQPPSAAQHQSASGAMSGAVRPGPRLGSSSGAFRQVKKDSEAQTESDWTNELQGGYARPNGKKDIMVEMIISMVQLHEKNNQSIRLSNLGPKLMALCGVEVTPRDFCCEDWEMVIYQHCNKYQQIIELERIRNTTDFHLFICNN